MLFIFLIAVILKTASFSSSASFFNELVQVCNKMLGYCYCLSNLASQTDCQGADNCYCPSVGDCENHHYTFTFTSLVHSNSHQGDHHRDYHITITATNHASLRTTRTVDILLDDSPPTVGVVWEGLSEDGQAEMDFTSSDVLHVRWHGYEDHESGIMLYRLMLAERCMTGPEMEEAQNATEVEQGSLATIRIPREGWIVLWESSINTEQIQRQTDRNRETETDRQADRQTETQRESVGRLGVEQNN